MPGPLNGVRVLELAAIGPVPFCGMMLADMGASVTRIDRTTDTFSDRFADICGRGKQSIAIDLRHDSGPAVALRLIATADVLIEGFRPGVAERLGVGPEPATEVNPRIIYGRMTGWGQEGPMAQMAGHDINYLAVAGALGAIGEADPVPPLNLVADYGGGAMYLLAGVLAALVDRQSSGLGQVIDAAMVDGVASLLTPTYQLMAAGLWSDDRRANLLDGGAPFYRTYRCADGGYVAVGALEPEFYRRLLELLGIDPDTRPPQHDRSGWPQLEADLAAIFASESRNHWERRFFGEDACVTPVLSLEEAPQHVQNQARSTFMTNNANPLPAPAPRFSRSASQAGTAAPQSGSDTVAVLMEVGFDSGEIEALAASGAIKVVQ